MIEKTNEDFGRDDRNFHPEEQRIIWETMENKEPAIDQLLGYGLDKTEPEKDNYHDQTDSEDDSENNKDQDIELDKELKDYSDQDFDKKDKSDS